MKKKFTILQKIKIIKMWLRQHNDSGLIECCHYCDSTRIVSVDSKKGEDSYVAQYKCLDCSATAGVIETWNIGLPQAIKTTESPSVAVAEGGISCNA